MDVNEKVNLFRALIMYVKKYLRARDLIFLLLGASLAAVLLLLPSCTSNHYFSINAEEISNPDIQYHDSTAVYNPF